MVSISRVAPAPRPAEDAMAKEYAMESMGVGVAMADLDGTLFYVNPTFLKMFQIGDSRDVVGMKILDFSSGAFSSNKTVASEGLISVKERGEWSSDATVRRNDGSIFHEHIVASIVRDASGQPCCMMACFVDMTDRMRMQEQLADQASLLNATIENTHAMLAYLDTDFRFVMANKAYIDRCGHSWEELNGKNHFDLFPNAENEAIFRRVRDTGARASFQDRPFEHADRPWRGITYWDWGLTPVKGRHNQVIGLVLSLIETTERKRTEEALKKTQESLINAQRIARLGSWEWDIKTGEVRWSDELYRVFGVDRMLSPPPSIHSSTWYIQTTVNWSVKLLKNGTLEELREEWSSG